MNNNNEYYLTTINILTFFVVSHSLTIEEKNPFHQKEENKTKSTMKKKTHVSCLINSITLMLHSFPSLYDLSKTPINI